MRFIGTVCVYYEIEAENEDKALEVAEEKSAELAGIVSHNQMGAYATGDVTVEADES